MKKLVVFALVVVLGILAVWVGLPAYRHWKQDRLVQQAEADLRKGDLKTAMFKARKVLVMNLSNVGACRVMAQAVEKMYPKYALEWWQRVVELQPDSVPDRLELARCASMLGENALAIKTLQGVGGTNLNTVAYNEVAAQVAAGINDLPLAEHHLNEALQLDPTNREVRLNAAVIHFNETNRRVVAEAIRTLEELTSDPDYGKDALRLLVMAASRDHDLVRADKYSAELAPDQSAPLNDVLVRLGVLKQEGSPKLGSMMERAKSRCAADPNEIYVLTEWLLENDLADTAAQWLDNLPAGTRAKLSVEEARAECYTSQKDWAGLKLALAKQNWDEDEYLRRAMLARASRQQGMDFKSQSDWLAATKLASARVSSLSRLIRVVNLWGWDKEREDLLWSMVQKFPSEKWALDMLSQVYLNAGDTRGLQKVNDMIVSFDAKNYLARNNLAMTSLLLNTQVPQARDLAADAYNHDPHNPVFASTQAFSLYLQKKPAEALQVMESLKPAQLENPSVALYYGLVLAANNQRDKAQTYFAIAARGRLLPEELALLTAARNMP